jgi:hypothetical protein
MTRSRPSAAILAVAASMTAGLAQAAPPPEPDRTAILAMAGEYAVTFDFTETVVLKPGYARKPGKRTGANEVVIVVEDTPARIVLQHLLVVGDGHVVKHWRQDWAWEAPTRFEFSADQTWTVRALAPERTKGAWTQCVYEVSDAPRYCGTARWVHDGAASTWESDRGWRPLPRREYTTRSDYNALGAVNRHTVTAEGWTHEQDNEKTVRDAVGKPTGAIVREFGFNEYRRTRGVDFAPAYRYWRDTAGFWAAVRTRWDRLWATGGVQLKTKVDGMAMIEPLFAQAGRQKAGGAVPDAEIDAVFAQWVTPLRSGGDITMR